MEQYNIEQFRELQAAQAKFNVAQKEATPALKAISKDLAARIHTAHKEHGFKTTHYYEDWMFSYDSIEIDFDGDNGEITINYIEDGRCGNNDECLHSIQVTEELLTPAGREAYVARWIEEQKKYQAEQKRKREQENLDKIKRLEAEIKQLSTQN